MTDSVPTTIEDARALDQEITDATKRRDLYEAAQAEEIADALNGKKAEAFRTLLDGFIDRLLPGRLQSDLVALRTNIDTTAGQAASRVASVRMQYAPPAIAALPPEAQADA